jgi:hypothetical protein
MNVLVATPTFGPGPHPLTVDAIGALESAHTWAWRQYRVNPYPVPDGRNVVAQYAAIRADFLSGDWDALLTIEHDMVPPPHALTALLATGAPVAYGVYLLRHGSLVLNAWEYIGSTNMGESFTLNRGPRPSGVVRVSGVGFGCTLFRRNVVEAIPFSDGGDAGQSPDIPFARACLTQGIEQVAHFGVLCGHVEGGQVLTPFVSDRTALVRAVAAQNANIRLDDGASFRIEAGQSYELPAPTIHEFTRGGYFVPASVDADLRPTGDDAGAQSPIAAQPEQRGLVPDGDRGQRAPRRRVGKRQPGNG